MRQFKVPGSRPDTHVGFSPTEKRKLIWLSLALVLVLASITAAWIKGRPSTDADVSELPTIEDELPVESVDLPEIHPQQFEALVSDRESADRVVLESDAVDAALDVVRLLTPRHYEVMGARELDREMIDVILADPSAFRAQPFFVRGMVDSIRERRRSLTSTEEYTGRILLEDDSYAYFLTLGMPETFIEGDYVRVDGLFLKAYSEESVDVSGEWIEGPLLVGMRAIRSYRSMGTVTELLARYVLEVRDEVLVNPDGSFNRDVKLGLPFDALWHTMAYARDLPEDAVDWEKAPELDKATLSRIMHDGVSNRLQPFRFPMSRLQHATVRRAGENPARIKYYTEGWLGNIAWNNVVYFQAPFEDRKARLTNFATARGFFLKNYAYESAAEGIRVAPVFVLHSLQIHEVEADPLFALVAYTLGGLTAVSALFFFFLLLRDRKKSAALQEKLLQRKRARRRHTPGSDSVGVTST